MDLQKLIARMDEIDQTMGVVEEPMEDEDEAERQEVLAKLQDSAAVIEETAKTIQSLMREQWDIADISNDAYNAIAEMIQHLKQHYDFSDMMEANPVQGLAESIEECGDMGPMSPMSQPKQQDNVNMNVSLNASGQGGIRDLLDILQNIESGKDDVEMPVAIKSMGMELDDDFANEPDEQYSSIDTMMPTGSDLHSKGIEAPKVNGGGNPMAHMERLENLYQQIKLQEVSKGLAAKAYNKMADGGDDSKNRTGLAGDQSDRLKARMDKRWGKDASDDAVKKDREKKVDEGSGPKEKQKTPYVDRSSPESKAKVQAAKGDVAKKKAAEPGKKLLSKINSK